MILSIHVSADETARACSVCGRYADYYSGSIPKHDSYLKFSLLSQKKKMTKSWLVSQKTRVSSRSDLEVPL